VRVTSDLHPLHGRALRATSFKRLASGLKLVVGLPDGSVGTIDAAATNIFGEQAPVGPATVITVEGLRRLRALVGLLQSGSGSTHGPKTRK
jgi:hypothetical protein